VDVEDDEVRGLRVIASDGLDAIPGLDDQIAGLAQRVGDEVEQVRIIVGDEDLHAGSAGRVSVKRVRSSGVRIAMSLPPWRSAMDREIDSPRPMPLGAGSTPPRLKRSNTDSSAPSGGPAPSSSTHATSWSAPRFAPMRIGAFAGANLLALASSVTSTCMRRIKST